MQPIPTYGEFEEECGESYYFTNIEDEFIKLNFKYGYKDVLEKRKAEEERQKQLEQEKLEEEARLAEEAKKKKKSSIKVKNPPPEPEPEPIIENQEEEKKDEEPKIQFEIDGEPCVKQLEIPFDNLKNILEITRDRLLSFYHNEFELRNITLTKLCEERVNNFTEELEDRLRKHWPRRGRIETKNKIPREGEILSHHQKYQRFIRSLVDKNSEDDRKFQAVMKEYRKELDIYKLSMIQLTEALPKQNNLSNLEGIHTRARELKEKLIKKSKDTHKKVLEYTELGPQKLRDSCTQYTNESILFSKGGEYDDEEVETDKKGFEEWLSGLDEIVKDRNEMIKSLTENENRETEKFPEFDKLVEKYVLDLSLRDGVGIKYGAPRRRLSEELRSEMARYNLFILLEVIKLKMIFNQI